MQNKTHKCGLCAFEFEHGVSVCRGCQGTVVYGPTANERQESAKLHGILWAGAAALLIYGLPQFLQTQFGWNVKMGWGAGFYSVIGVIVAGFGGAIRGGYAEAESKAGTVRTFRRM